MLPQDKLADLERLRKSIIKEGEAEVTRLMAEQRRRCVTNAVLRGQGHWHILVRMWVCMCSMPEQPEGDKPRKVCGLATTQCSFVVC